MDIKTLQYSFLILIAVFQIWAFLGTLWRTRSLQTAFETSKAWKLLDGLFLPDQLGRITGHEIHQKATSLPGLSGTEIDFRTTEDQNTGSGAPEKVKLFHGAFSNPILNYIQYDLNLYLVRNKNHGTDFKIIRDIIERHCDASTNQIERSLNMPLYWGLLGTIAGVAVGAYNLGSNAVLGQANVNDLLTTVGMAMTVSGLGLILTIFNNIIYRSAAHRLEVGCNNFLSFVQSDLLPVLSTDLNQSMQTLHGNMAAFNQGFTRNLVEFSKSLEGVQKNLAMQERFLNKLEENGFNHITREMLQLFEEMAKSTEAFKQFKKYQQELAVSFGAFTGSMQNMQQVLDRTENFEGNLKELIGHIQQQDKTYHRILEIVEDNADFLEERKQKVQTVISVLDSYTRTQYESLIDRTSSKQKELGEAFSTQESNTRQAFERFRTLLDDNVKLLKEDADKELQRIREAYQNNQPQFDQLSRLTNIEQTLQYLPTFDQSADLNNRLTNALEELRKHLEKIEKHTQEKKVVLLKKSVNGLNKPLNKPAPPPGALKRFRTRIRKIFWRHEEEA